MTLLKSMLRAEHHHKSPRQFVFVDILTLAMNKSKNQVTPPILVTGGGNNEAPRSGCRVRINGPCEVVYDKRGTIHPGDAPHIVIVTEAPVEIIEEYIGYEMAKAD